MKHVRGHSGDFWNTVADELADRGVKEAACATGRFAPGFVAVPGWARRWPLALSAAYFAGYDAAAHPHAGSFAAAPSLDLALQLWAG